MRGAAQTEGDDAVKYAAAAAFVVVVADEQKRER